jgi:hypothetical protein
MVEREYREAVSRGKERGEVRGEETILRTVSKVLAFRRAEL